MERKHKLFFLVLIFFLNTSCATVSSVTALVGSKSTSTRGFAGSMEDTYLITKIIGKISTLQLSNVANITVSVNSGKVLLTGNISNQSKRLELIKNVWKVDGVKEIFNEIQINSAPSFSERAEDLLFETKIKNRLLFKKGIYSNNYSVDVVNGTVYVMGVATNLNEKNNIDNFLKEMDDIKALVTIISIPKSPGLRMTKSISCVFQMDPLKNLNFETDSTVALIRKAITMGIDVWFTTANTLTFIDNRAKVIGQFVENTDLKLGPKQQLSLEKFDYYFIRQDPPFDMDYLTNLYILEIHNKVYEKPFFVNHPSSIKNFTEKIFPFFFDEFMPYSVISADIKIFSEMVEKFGTVVLKTLYNKRRRRYSQSY